MAKLRHIAINVTDAEKAAIAYADISSTDHFSIDDRTFSNLRRFFSEAEIVELAAFIAYFIGFGRLAASMDMIEELPAAFQDKTEKAAPWLQDGVPTTLNQWGSPMVEGGLMGMADGSVHLFPYTTPLTDFLQPTSGVPVTMPN